MVCGVFELLTLLSWLSSKRKENWLKFVRGENELVAVDDVLIEVVGDVPDAGLHDASDVLAGRAAVVHLIHDVAGVTITVLMANLHGEVRGRRGSEDVLCRRWDGDGCRVDLRVVAPHLAIQSEEKCGVMQRLDGSG